MEANKTRFRSLLAALAGSDGELVVAGNGFAALGAGALAGLGYGIPIGWSALLAGTLFVLLMLCLLSPRASWIPAIVGGLVLAAVPAALLGAVAVRLYPPAIWAGAGTGLLLGFWLGVRTLLAFARKVQNRQPDAR